MLGFSPISSGPLAGSDSQDGDGPGSISTNLVCSYSIRQSVAEGLAVSYDVLERLTKNLTTSYSIVMTSQVLTTLTASYGIIARVTKELTVSYWMGDGDGRSNVEDLEKALRAGVVACVSLPLSVENISFEKPGGNAPWAAMFILHGMPVTGSCGIGGRDLHTGFIQVDLNYPTLIGTEAVAAMARVVTDFLRPGRVLQYGNTTAMVTQSGSPRNREVEGYYRRSLTINWQAFIDRPV